MSTAITILLALTPLVGGLLSGAGINYVIKQLPARKEIGIIAY